MEQSPWIDRSITTFLQYLTTFPAPDQVTRSLVLNALNSFQARSCDLWSRERYSSLTSVGKFGHTDDQKIYQQISLAVVSPITQSFLSGEIVIIPLSQVLEHYPALNLDSAFWAGLLDDYGDGDLVHTPIISEGATIGVYTFLSDRIHSWSAIDLSQLDLIAAALALWMSHPRSGISNMDNAISGAGLSLTQRQLEILELVRSGKSNGAIAAHLGYSQSTVKQELLRITRRLRVNNRHDAVLKATELNLMPSADA